MKKRLVSDYWPNPSRAIKIHGGIKGEFAKNAFENAATLTGTSSAPITLFIKSSGGSVGRIKLFEELFSCRASRASSVQFITVADGDVRSAAAYLLLMGHFAYAKADVQIGFHGTRYRVIRPLTSIKKGDAVSMAIRLDKQNRRIAEHLSEAIVYRIVHRFLESTPSAQFSEWNTSSIRFGILTKFIEHVRNQLSSAKSKTVLDQSYEYMETILQMTTYFEPIRLENLSKEQATQAKILETLLSKKVEVLIKENKALDETVVLGLMFDYFSLRDLLAREPTHFLKNLTECFGERFLSDSEAFEYKQIKYGLNPRCRFLFEHTNNRLQVFWYFAMALSKKLLIGENPLPASDAYWLGLIDGVLDSNLTWTPLPGEVRRRPFNNP